MVPSLALKKYNEIQIFTVFTCSYSKLTPVSTLLPLPVAGRRVATFSERIKAQIISRSGSR
jgi:hypothetical protein